MVDEPCKVVTGNVSARNYRLRDRIARVVGAIAKYKSGPNAGKLVAQWIKDNPGTPQPKAPDLAVLFFNNFSKDNPGRFPSAVTHQAANGKSTTDVEPVKDGSDVQSIFFDMWRADHADADLEDVPGDMVTTSGSGLDPHITLQNADYQLDRWWLPNGR